MDKKMLLIKEWMRKAEHDMGMATLALENKPEYTDAICFHLKIPLTRHSRANGNPVTYSSPLSRGRPVLDTGLDSCWSLPRTPMRGRNDIFTPLCADLSACVFHCLQAVKKYVKAYLVSLDISFEKKHSLAYLLDLISEKESIVDEIYEQIEKLEGYAVEIRYPDDWFEPSLEDAKEAFEIARNREAVIRGKRG